MLTMCVARRQVREYSHGFFANTAMALQDDFAVYLPHVVPLALTSLALDDGPLLDGLIEDDDEEEDGLGSGGGSGGGVVAGVRAALGDNDDNDDEEDDEEEQKRKEKIHTAIMDEKMSACHALGSFMQATKGAFAPYIKEVTSSQRPTHPPSQLSSRLSSPCANSSPSEHLVYHLTHLSSFCSGDAAAAEDGQVLPRGRAQQGDVRVGAAGEGGARRLSARRRGALLLPNPTSVMEFRRSMPVGRK